MKQKTIEKTADYIKSRSQKDHSGHDWWHTYRVWNLSKKIANKEGANLYIVELGALLHDIADYKFHNGDEEIGITLTRAWLEKLKIDEKTIQPVTDIVKNISFKGANTENKINTLEGECVQDADRLDAMGATGIARCFAYGGYKGNPIYDPSIPANPNKTKEEYIKSDSTQINHFYEKLLLLKDRMNTQTGKQIAETRHQFMTLFLKKFFNEWENK